MCLQGEMGRVLYKPVSPPPLDKPDPTNRNESLFITGFISSAFFVCSSFVQISHPLDQWWVFLWILSDAGKRCPVLDSPENGKVHHQDIVYNSTITFSCSEGWIQTNLWSTKVTQLPLTKCVKKKSKAGITFHTKPSGIIQTQKTAKWQNTITFVGPIYIPNIPNMIKPISSLLADYRPEAGALLRSRPAFIFFCPPVLFLFQVRLGWRKLQQMFTHRSVEPRPPNLQTYVW